jgi:hypothetical protein
MLLIDHLIDESMTEAMIEIRFCGRVRMFVAADGGNFEKLFRIQQ